MHSRAHFARFPGGQKLFYLLFAVKLLHANLEMKIGEFKICFA
jgi:hypothetical protein